MSAPRELPAAGLRPRLTRAGAAFLLVSLWGCWAIHNATRAGFGDRNFTARQGLWILLGSAALVLASGVPPHLYRRLVPLLAGISYLSLLLVLVVGVRINGMCGWFAWRGYFLQPAEIAKPLFILSLALLLERTEPARRSWSRGLLPLTAFLLAWIAPICLQPDFGSVLIYALVFVVLYWVSGRPSRHLAVLAAAGIPAAAVVLVRHPYVFRRVEAFLDPEAHALTSGWHLLQLRRTLASGGLLGRAWEEGLWSQSYLPLGYSDSVFASTAERLGFVGVLPILLLILGLLAYVHHHACRAPTRFESFAIFGLGAMIVSQAFIHLSVNLGLMPPTGVTLPLVSYGGSSLMASMLAFGILEAMAARRTSEPPSPTP